jgi:phosphate/sulfate permease
MTLALIFVIALVANLFISNEVGKVAQTRELGRKKAFWISFILSPILGLLFVLASLPLTQEQVNKMNIITPEQEDQEQKQQNQIAFILVVALFVGGLIYYLNN